MVVEPNALNAGSAHTTSSGSAPRLARSHGEIDASEVAERVIGELFGTSSIFSQLLPRYLAGDPVRGRFPQLAPHPVVDRALGRLVAIARGELGPPHTRAEARAALLARIQGDPALRDRARALRQLAAVAETELEHHYSERLLARLAGATAPLDRVSHGALRMHRLLAHLRDFPYAANYAHLVSAELSLLETDVAPLFVRDRELARLQEHGSAAARTLQALRDVHGSPLPPVALADATIAVVGCGPLPITGLMLHAWTGSAVTLVDLDRSSVERSCALVRELERLSVIDEGAVRVLLGDAAEPAEWGGAVDVVLVASLVPHAAKLRLARALVAATSGKPFALLVRSAAGLCAELAYEPVATHEISCAALAFCGESVPAHQVSSSRELIVVAHESVLNTTELYRTRPERK